MNIKNEGGIYEVFVPVQRKSASLKSRFYSIKNENKSDSGFTDFEESEPSCVDKDSPVRLGFRKNLSENSAQYRREAFRKRESEDRPTENDVEVLEANPFACLKHTQTENPVNNKIEKWRERNKGINCQQSNISIVDSGQSPTIRMSKYRWVNASRTPIVSLDSSPREHHPQNKPSTIPSDSESQSTERVKSSKKMSNRTKKSRSQPSDFEKVKYVEEDALFLKQADFKTSEDITYMVEEALKTDSDNKWAGSLSDSLNDSLKSPRRETTNRNANIMLKNLDSFYGDKKKVSKNPKADKEKHLLIPSLNKDSYTSKDNLNTMKEDSTKNLLPNAPVERKNTTGLRNTEILETSLKKKKIIVLPKKNSNKIKKIKSREQMHQERMKKKEKQYEKMILMLITKGEVDKLSDFLSKVNINLEFKDSDGNTPFNIAAQSGYAGIAEVLLRHGSIIDTQNNQGNTAMHYAQSYNFPHMLTLLVNNGANQTVQNNNGKIPWEGL